MLCEVVGFYSFIIIGCFFEVNFRNIVNSEQVKSYIFRLNNCLIHFLRRFKTRAIDTAIKFFSRFTASFWKKQIGAREHELVQCTMCKQGFNKCFPILFFNWSLRCVRFCNSHFQNTQLKKTLLLSSKILYLNGKAGEMVH